jgi:hypothetical protein
VRGVAAHRAHARQRLDQRRGGIVRIVQVDVDFGRPGAQMPAQVGQQQRLGLVDRHHQAPARLRHPARSLPAIALASAYTGPRFPAKRKFRPDVITRFERVITFRRISAQLRGPA